jgi:hypothetical protein
VVGEMLDTAAAHGRWRRGRCSSRPRAAPLDLSRRWFGQRGRGSGLEASSTRNVESVERAARRGAYAASAFRYVDMRAIMPASTVR